MPSVELLDLPTVWPSSTLSHAVLADLSIGRRFTSPISSSPAEIVATAMSDLLLAEILHRLLLISRRRRRPAFSIPLLSPIGWHPRSTFFRLLATIACAKNVRGRVAVTSTSLVGRGDLAHELRARSEHVLLPRLPRDRPRRRSIVGRRNLVSTRSGRGAERPIHGVSYRRRARLERLAASASLLQFPYVPCRRVLLASGTFATRRRAKDETISPPRRSSVAAVLAVSDPRHFGDVPAGRACRVLVELAYLRQAPLPFCASPWRIGQDGFHALWSPPASIACTTGDRECFQLLSTSGWGQLTNRGTLHLEVPTDENIALGNGHQGTWHSP